MRRPNEVANLAHFWEKSNHTFGFAVCHGLFQAIWSLQRLWLLLRYNYFVAVLITSLCDCASLVASYVYLRLSCFSYQSQIIIRNFIGHLLHSRSDIRRPLKCSAFRGGGFSPVSPLLRTPLVQDETCEQLHCI